MKLKSIIIEDDPLSMQLLKDIISRIDDVEIINTYATAKDAYNDLESIKNIDLIFLDIEMPDMTGLDFLKYMDKGPEIIIISGRAEYAIDAFEFEVSDYLLKPPSLPRLLKAIKKVKKHITVKREKPVAEGTNANSIFLKTDKGIKSFVPDNIIHIEAMENYVKIYYTDGVYISHNTIKKMLEILPSKYFMRVHRSYILNLKKIKLIQSHFVEVETTEGAKVIPIGKKYRDEFFNRINVQ